MIRCNNASKRFAVYPPKVERPDATKPYCFCDIDLTAASPYVQLCTAINLDLRLSCAFASCETCPKVFL